MYQARLYNVTKYRCLVSCFSVSRSGLKISHYYFYDGLQTILLRFKVPISFQS